jgi:hypothetical protein
MHRHVSTAAHITLACRRKGQIADGKRRRRRGRRRWSWSGGGWVVQLLTTSVLPSISSDVFVSMETSDPISNGDAMSDQRAKCERCSVTERPMSPTCLQSTDSNVDYAVRVTQLS